MSSTLNVCWVLPGFFFLVHFLKILFRQEPEAITDLNFLFLGSQELLCFVVWYSMFCKPSFYRYCLLFSSCFRWENNLAPFTPFWLIYLIAFLSKVTQDKTKKQKTFLKLVSLFYLSKCYISVSLKFLDSLVIFTTISLSSLPWPSLHWLHYFQGYHRYLYC